MFSFYIKINDTYNGYRNKLVDIKKQLQQLQNGTHVEYIKQLKEYKIHQKKQYDNLISSI